MDTDRNDTSSVSEFQEELQYQISEMISDSDDLIEIQIMIDDYEAEYGQDAFIKQASFDLSEIASDPQGMKEMLDEMSEPEFSSTVLKINTARCWYAQGDIAQAMEVLDKEPMLDDSEESLMFLHLKAYCAIGLGQFEKAVHCLEDVLLDLEDAQSLCLAGLCWLKLGDMERAEEYLQRGQASLSEHDRTWLVSFIIQNDLSDLIELPVFFPEIRQLYKKTVKDDNQITIRSLQNLIDSKPEMMLSVVQEELDEDENNLTANYLMGLCYEKLQDISLARKYFRKALRLPLPASPEEAQEVLPIKLICLESLDYSDKVAARYILDLYQQGPDTDEFRLQLAVFCGIHALMKTMDFMLQDGGIPQWNGTQEEFTLKDSLIELLIYKEDPSQAWEVSSTMFGRRMDLGYYLEAAFLWMICPYEEMVPDFIEEHMQNQHMFEEDFVFLLEVLRLSGSLQEFSSLLETAMEVQKNYGQTWQIFDEYMDYLNEKMELSDNEQPILEGMTE